VAWTPKAGLTDTLQLNVAFAAALTLVPGLEWLAAYAFLVEGAVIELPGFCAAGPHVAPALTLDDFLNIGSDPIGLKEKIGQVARDMVFGSVCEQVTTGVTGVCQTGQQVLPANPATSYPDKNAESAGDVITNSSVRKWLKCTMVSVDQFFGDVGVKAPDGTTYNIVGGSFDPGVLFSEKSGPVSFPLVDGLQFWVFGYAPHQCTFNWEVVCDDMTTTDPHIPTEQPSDLVPLPPAPTTADLAAIAAAIDALEFKTAFVSNAVSWLASQVAVAPATRDDAVTAEPGVPLVAKGAVGFLVVVSGIPASADEAFSDPPQYHRLGRITIGSADGWLPSFDLEHSPQLVMPLPLGSDRIVVHAAAPAVATVQALYPPK
jgi:hypothetical protein